MGRLLLESAQLEDPVHYVCVFRRQILASKVDPRTERVKYL